jgi:hypothetical protein
MLIEVAGPVHADMGRGVPVYAGRGFAWRFHKAAPI